MWITVVDYNFKIKYNTYIMKFIQRVYIIRIMIITISYASSEGKTVSWEGHRYGVVEGFQSLII